MRHGEKGCRHRGDLSERRWSGVLSTCPGFETGLDSTGLVSMDGSVSGTMRERIGGSTQEGWLSQKKFDSGGDARAWASSRVCPKLRVWNLTDARLSSVATVRERCVVMN